MAFFSAPGGGNPQNRLVVLCTLLVLVLASMYSCQQHSHLQNLGGDPSTQEMVTASPDVHPADPLPEVRPRDKLETMNIVDFVGSDDEDPRRAHDLSRIRPALDEAFGWLKTQSREELQARAWPRGRWSRNKIMQHPERWRLQVLHVYGMLLHHETLDLPTMPRGLQKLHRLILFDVRRHVAYTVLTPLMPKAARSMQGNDSGDYLACDAIFLMRYPYFSGDDRWKPTPLLLAKETYLAREPLNVPERLDMRGDPKVDYPVVTTATTVDRLDIDALEELIFAPPKDGAGHNRGIGVDYHRMAEDLQAEKPALDHVFAYVHGMSDEDLRRQANPEIDYVALMQDNEPPGWMRGKIVHARVLAAFVRTWFFPDEYAASGINRFHVVIGHDTSLNGPQFTWALAVPNLPENLHEDEVVEAEGVFVKLFPYRTLEGTWHWAPLLVCKELRRVESASRSMSTGLYVGISIAFVVGAFLIWLAGRRDTDDLQRMRKHALERRIQQDRQRPIAPRSGETAPRATDSVPSTPADTQPSGDARSPLRLSPEDLNDPDDAGERQLLDESDLAPPPPDRPTDDSQRES